MYTQIQIILYEITTYPPEYGEILLYYHTYHIFFYFHLISLTNYNIIILNYQSNEGISMKINELYKRKKTVISFEIFPPKKEPDISGIYTTLEKLGDLSPDFISVTYSAGGSANREMTLDIAAAIKNQYKVESVAHLTCISSDRAEVGRMLNKAEMLGIENILALRGDIPEGFSGEPAFHFAKELIYEIKNTHPSFCVGATAYPEGHIDCETMEKNVEYLKEKADAGAEFLITQLFFDNRCFYEFYDKTLSAGLRLPISAGVMPIISKSQIEKMIFMCGASLPAKLVRVLRKYEHNAEDLQKAAIEYSANQINDLIAHKVDGIHIYTMNRPEIARENLKRLEKWN